MREKAQNRRIIQIYVFCHVFIIHDLFGELYIELVKKNLWNDFTTLLNDIGNLQLFLMRFYAYITENLEKKNQNKLNPQKNPNQIFKKKNQRHQSAIEEVNRFLILEILNVPNVKGHTYPLPP